MAGRRSGGVAQPAVRSGGGFVGRRLELDELRAAFAAAADGRGGLVLLRGEPGVGKTRLADELCAHARTQGAEVLWGRCWEGGGAPAYWPWVQVVRALLRGRPPGALDGVLGAGVAHIAELAPELRDALPDLPAASPDPEPEQRRFALFAAVEALLRRAGQDAPVVLVLDDVHAADRASLLLLRFVAAELRGARLLVLVCYREVDARRDPEVGPLLDELGRLGRGLPLRGLDEAEVADLLDEAGGGGVDRALARALHRVTDGNPFYVDELVRLLRAEGRLDRAFRPGEPLGVPDGVVGAIRRRLATLSPEASEVLDVAAVAGRDFDGRLVERISRLPAEDVLAALDEAVGAQLVVETLRAVRRYSFRHGLVRETLLQALPAGRRAHLHLAAGRALEELHGEDMDQRLDELAHHFFEAAAVGGAGRALELSVRAGRRATEVLAYDEARGHFERALQALTLTGAADPRRRCELLLSRAESEWSAGESAAARSTFRHAAALARELEAPELLARAALGHARGLGGFLHVVRADQAIIGLLEEALAALPLDDGGLRARVLARLAVELYYTDQVARRSALSQEAVAMARRLDDPAALLVALYSRHWAACGPETLDERLAGATEMVALARQTGSHEMTFLGHHLRLNCLLERCDGAGVDAELQAMVDLSSQARQPYLAWRTTCLLAMRAILDARFDEAERLTDRAFELGRGSEPEIATVVREGAQMFALRFGQGRLAELEPSVRDFTRRYPWIQPWRLPLLLSELGRTADARAELERQAAHDFEDFPRDGLWITRVAALAHACALVGDAARAQQLHDLLLPYAERNVSTIADQSYGPVATRLGMLATVLGRWEDAERHFTSAVALCGSLGAPTALALTQAEHARMLLDRDRPGDRERARELLAAAEALCRERGIGGMLQRVLAQQERAGRPRDEPAPAAGCRFVCEGEVWTIAFDGDVLRLRDSKGLRYLAHLLARPGVEVHALDLVGADARREGVTAPGAAEVAQAGLQAGRPGGVGAALDPQAKAAYRARLLELEGELDEARTFHDPERAARLEEERDALRHEIAAAVGLGGRDRPQASPAERARVNVTRSIRSAIARIEAGSPALGAHLTEAVRTGTACAYLPVRARRPPQ